MAIFCILDQKYAQKIDEMQNRPKNDPEMKILLDSKKISRIVSP
jgi:hypothetical protein